MRVKNLNNTADRTPPSGYTSWKDFFLGRRHFWPSICACYGCSNAAEVGAHVKKVDNYDNRWHIVPLCRYHNNQFGEELDVYDSWLEPINKE